MASQSPAMNDEQSVAQQLQYKDQAALLDAIDKMRARGLPQYISLPTIVVCGDQSSGKSSVLEALSHVRFPVNDTLCTTFATELIIRRQEEPGRAVEIIPGEQRSEADKVRLKAFSGQYTGPDDLPNLIQAAKAAMSSSSAGHQQRTFFDDRLQVRICKPNWPPLTIVDLPGLIHARNPDGSHNDVTFVKSLVKRYMEKARTIILAIVSAQSDTANQEVLSLAKTLDPQGVRTLGVITKPDTLPPVGSQSLNNYLCLARNEIRNYHFQQGWHVLKNRSYHTRQQTAAERDAAERDFFSGDPWSSIDSSSLGIDALRKRLSKLLHVQIVSKLDEVRNDIRSGIEDCQKQLTKLGASRSTEVQKREYLTTIAERARSYIEAGTHGAYIDTFFGPPSGTDKLSKRLRARLQAMNEDFADAMHSRGHRWQISQDHDAGKSFKFVPAVRLGNGGSGEHSKYPEVIAYSRMVSMVDEMARESRGQEPQGLANPHVVGEVFRQQSERWVCLATHHIKGVWNAVKEFLDSVFEASANSETSNIVMCEHIEPAMQAKLEIALSKLDDISKPFTKHNPISFNKRLLSIVDEKKQKRVDAQQRDELSSSGGSSFSGSKSAVFAQSRPSSSIDRFGSASLLDYMQAYYEVAISTYIDNVVSLVIETCFIDDLQTIFAPTTIATLSEEQLNTLASESDEAKSGRRTLEDKLDCLNNGLIICNSHSHFVPRGAQKERRPAAPSSSNGSEELESLISAQVGDLNLRPTSSSTAATSNTRPTAGLFGTPSSSSFTISQHSTTAIPATTAASTTKTNGGGSLFSTQSSPFAHLAQTFDAAAAPTTARTSNSGITGGGLFGINSPGPAEFSRSQSAATPATTESKTETRNPIGSSPTAKNPSPSLFSKSGASGSSSGSSVFGGVGAGTGRSPSGFFFFPSSPPYLCDGTDHFESIVAHPSLRANSFEEHRLADYDMGRRMKSS